MLYSQNKSINWIMACKEVPVNICVFFVHDLQMSDLFKARQWLNHLITVTSSEQIKENCSSTCNAYDTKCVGFPHQEDFQGSSDTN